MIIESIRDFIKECPHLSEFAGVIGVESLDADPVCYAIESVPVSPVVKRYTDGSSVRQFAFNFLSKAPYNNDVLENIENCGFFEHFSDWMEERTITKDLPKMGSGKTAKKIQAMSPGYLFNEEGNQAFYQIQCKLTYFQERMI